MANLEKKLARAKKIQHVAARIFWSTVCVTIPVVLYGLAVLSAYVTLFIARRLDSVTASALHASGGVTTNLSPLFLIDTPRMVGMVFTVMVLGLILETSYRARRTARQDAADLEAAIKTSARKAKRANKKNRPRPRTFVVAGFGGED